MSLIRYCWALISSVLEKQPESLCCTLLTYVESQLTSHKCYCIEISLQLTVHLVGSLSVVNGVAAVGKASSACM